MFALLLYVCVRERMFCMYGTGSERSRMYVLSLVNCVGGMLHVYSVLVRSGKSHSVLICRSFNEVQNETKNNKCIH